MEEFIMVVKEVKVNDYVTKSNLPASDYVINPYVGCSHACKYCYASFMKRFTGHKEEWGTFVDVKKCDKPINISKLKGKNVFLSSVTDPYNHLEKDYEVTRKILEQLVEAKCHLSISTKSDLILRDIDILKKFDHLEVCVSINTTEEKFRQDMDAASSIEERFCTLKTLHESGIHTVLFMSPIFPYITDWKNIIERSKDFVDEYWFENLNLRGQYKNTILNYIRLNFPQYYDEYIKIYVSKCSDYWSTLAREMEEYCKEKNVNYCNFFYHEKLVSDKKESEKNGN